MSAWTRGLELEAADQIAALAEGVNVAVHGLEPVDRGPVRSEQLVLHVLEMLGDDEQAGFRQQVMDIGNPARQRVLDRDHRPSNAAGRDRLERLLEGLARKRHKFGIGLAAGEMGIGTGDALEGDRLFGQADRVGGVGRGHG